MEELNRYLKTQASQDVSRDAAGCWVATAPNNEAVILGYYTLSPEAV